MSIAAGLAALHARAMIHATPWSEAGFEDMLRLPGVFLETLPSSLPKYPGGGPEDRGQSPLLGFAVGRVTAGEAELLTLAVDPGMQRAGHGRTLLQAFENAASERGAATVFLEVAEDNRPAVALYLGRGWAIEGVRRGYYPRAASDPASALILRKTVSPA